MKNNELNANTLIKRKNLIIFLNKLGINRINIKALNKIELIIRDDLKNLVISLKELIKIKGRKTLLEEDIEEIIKNHKKENYPEI